MERLTGSDIPFELYRVFSVNKRPYLRFHTTLAEHQGGIIYEGASPSGLVTSFDNQGKIACVTLSCELDKGVLVSGRWLPDNMTYFPMDRKINWLEVYWLSDYYNKSKMVKGWFEDLEKGFSGIYPKEVINRQRAIEASLPNHISIRYGQHPKYRDMYDIPKTTK